MMARRGFSSAAGGKNVGFVGLGCMGQFMSRNLVNAGHHVKGFDLSADARAAAAANGVQPAESMAEASADVDYIVTCLPQTQHVEEALTMDGGILASCKPDTLVCDTSTIHPDGARKFYKLAQEAGSTYLDTPMSGGVTGADKGTLTFMVGGSEAEFERAKTVLEGMGMNFFHCGDTGAGCIAKIVNNMVLGISMIASSEGMAIGEKLGIDPAMLQKVMAVSSARNWCIDTYNPRPGLIPGTPACRNYENGFAVSLIKKDMVLALEAAHSVKAETDMLEKSLQYYVDLEKAGLGRKDLGYVYQYLMKNKTI